MQRSAECRWFWPLLVVFIWTFVRSNLATNTTNECVDLRNCRECIANLKCSWCMDTTFDSPIPHCNTPDEHIRINACTTPAYNPQLEYTVEPEPENHSLIITPHRINLKLRVGQEHKWRLTYNQPESYPVDFYFLMDLSYTMKDDKAKLETFGDQLATILSNITNDYHLGFGSFVDKEMLPFISTLPDTLKNPCHPHEICAPAYAFKHIASLSKDATRFQNSIRDAPVSASTDHMEAGLDALVQVIVCGDKIGWRNRSRRMILYASDDSFHYAGDGRFGGIIQKNDGKCHVENNEYTASTTTDYPSVSLVNKLAHDHAVNIIFAVTEEFVPIYKLLSENIVGSTYAELKDDSSNMFKLVADQYKTIRDKIEIQFKAPDYIAVEFYSTCNNATAMKRTSECTGIKNGAHLEFEVRLKLTGCPEKRSDSKYAIVTIFSPLDQSQGMVVNVTTMCECECGGSDDNVPACGGDGALRCGVCDCIEGKFGSRCQCDGNPTDMKQQTLQCLNKDAQICGNRGTCECGKCSCHKHKNETHVISGEFCELDNFSCPRPDDQICSGHGKCVDNECQCEPGFNHTACDCSTLVTNCMHDGQICSGHGVCECNECRCRTDAGHTYMGKLCNECTTCGLSCDGLSDCVKCLAHHQGMDDATCATVCAYIDHEPKGELADLDGDPCSYYDDNQCRFSFVYAKKEANVKKVTVWTSPLRCPPQPQTTMIACCVVGGIVTTGIAAMIIWKVVTGVHDRREYARFEQNEGLRIWEEMDNPMYKSPKIIYTNPMYDGN